MRAFSRPSGHGFPLTSLLVVYGEHQTDIRVRFLSTRAFIVKNMFLKQKTIRTRVAGFRRRKRFRSSRSPVTFMSGSAGRKNENQPTTPSVGDDRR